MNSPVPLMHHDPDRSWITDQDPKKRNAPLVSQLNLMSVFFFLIVKFFSPKNLILPSLTIKLASGLPMERMGFKKSNDTKD